MATEQKLIQTISEIESVDTLRDIFSAVANAIREKGINKNPIYPNEMAELIANIETGFDVSEGTAVASDLAYDKIAYSFGGRIVGNINTIDSGSSVSLSPSGNVNLLTNKVYVNAQISNDILLRSGSKPGISVEPDLFGNATVEDVLSGYTFTSAAGFLEIGRYKPPEPKMDIIRQNVSDSRYIFTDHKIAYRYPTQKGIVIGVLVEDVKPYPSSLYGKNIVTGFIIINDEGDMKCVNENGVIKDVSYVYKEDPSSEFGIDISIGDDYYFYGSYTLFIY